MIFPHFPHLLYTNNTSNTPATVIPSASIMQRLVGLIFLMFGLVTLALWGISARGFVIVIVAAAVQMTAGIFLLARRNVFPSEPGQIQPNGRTIIPRRRLHRVAGFWFLGLTAVDASTAVVLILSFHHPFALVLFAYGGIAFVFAALFLATGIWGNIDTVLPAPQSLLVNRVAALEDEVRRLKERLGDEL